MSSDKTVRIGVTGHRFLVEVDKLRAAVDRALDEIQRASAGRELQAVSPLAEGADRLVAEAVLQRGGDLTVPLPLPVEDYLQDSGSRESKVEFRQLLERAAELIELPAAPTRDEAYEQVGLYVLENCDVLIAVYDGQPSQGRGGTAEMVEHALQRGMPVLHVKAGNRRPGTNEPTSLGEEQGELVVHNL